MATYGSAVIDTAPGRAWNAGGHADPFPSAIIGLVYQSPGH